MLFCENITIEKAKTISPVTHTADVEVKSASVKDVHSCAAEEIGSVSKNAPSKITPANPSSMIWKEDNFLFGIPM